MHATSQGRQKEETFILLLVITIISLRSAGTKKLCCNRAQKYLITIKNGESIMKGHDYLVSRMGRLMYLIINSLILTSFSIKKNWCNSRTEATISKSLSFGILNNFIKGNVYVHEVTFSLYDIFLLQ